MDIPLNVRAALEREAQITEAIRVSLSAYRSTIGDPEKNHVIYASSAITTGKRLYEYMREHGITSLEDFRRPDNDAYMRFVKEENIKDGKAFAEELRTLEVPSPQDQKKLIPPIVIAPVDFLQLTWSDEMYMTMWNAVIKQFADEVSFNSNPFYSTGQSEEFYTGLCQNKLLTLRGSREPMDPRQSLQLFEESIDDIATTLGKIPSKLYKIYRDTEIWVKG
ncbi:MAG: hypothetical protein V1725_06815 [archaeon]